jgi:exonuclease III
MDKLGTVCKVASAHDFVCLQEVGADGRTSLPVVSKELRKLGAQIILHSKTSDIHGDCKSGVGIIVSSDWQVDQVHRDDHGRAMAVVASNGNRIATIISVYMPSGLDQASATSIQGRLKRKVAQDVYAFVAAFIKIDNFLVIGGDFNETRDILLDRRHKRDREPIAGGPRPDCLLNDFIERWDLCDVFRSLNPDKIGYTWQRKRDNLAPDEFCSMSRIDHILVPSWSMNSGGFSWSFETSSYRISDHVPITASLAIDGKGFCPRDPWADSDKVWSPKHPRVARANDNVRQKIAVECERRAFKFLKTWPNILKNPGDGRYGLQQRRIALDRLVRRFLGLIRRTTAREIPKRSKTIRLSPLVRAREIVKALKDVALSVDKIRAGSGSPASKSHRKAVTRLSGLVGCYLGARHDDLDGLSTIVSTLLDNGTLLSQLEAEWKAKPDRLSDREYAEHLYDNVATLRQFVNMYLRGSRHCVINSATKDGKLTRDPREYKPIIKDIVRGNLSKRVALPAATATLDDPTTSLYESTDIRTRGYKPEWWSRVYNREAKGIPSALFGDILDSASEDELKHTISQAAGGKSPGHDGCDIDLLKLISDRSQVTLPLGQRHTTCLTVMCRLINLSFSLREIPPTLKHGWITMVPKVKADGSFSRDAGKMRPITVLPELGKLASRILAKRIDRILVQNPNVLSSAQRGFQMDGYVAQCTDVLVDVIEDWQQANQGPGSSDLFVVSYDQAKAYDSVQEYTIRASLERFNMPVEFIDYVTSGLRDANSQVRTEGGLTDPFELTSSVRQGDPLAPLIYAIITDAMHDGFVDNQQQGVDAGQWGYRFSKSDPLDNTAVWVRSCGYADDTIIVASSPASLEAMHNWVREFYGAHAFSLNCAKSEYLCSNGSSPPALFSVDCRTSITAQGEEHTIRYLGLWVNLRLDWTVQERRMWQRVNWIASVIRRHRFNLRLSVFAVQQYLLPCIRIGLETADVSSQTVNEWDKRIRQAAIAGAGISSTRLSVDGFLCTSGIPSLEDHRWAIRGEELMVRLNAKFPSSSTGRARWAAGGSKNSSRIIKTRKHLEKIGAKISASWPEGPRDTVELCVEGPWNPQDFQWLSWTPRLRPWLLSLERGWPEDEVCVYTDGSTDPRVKGKASGSSAVLVRDGVEIVSHGFPCRPSGSNYLSEVVAILAAILMVPAQTPVAIYSDCLSAIQAVNKGRLRDWTTNKFRNKYALSQRSRITCAARPTLEAIRSTIEKRSGLVRLEHVRSHTGKLDIHSRMNDVADKKANEVRIEHRHSTVPLDLFGEYDVTMGIVSPSSSSSSPYLPVVGSYRIALLRALKKARLNRWASRTPASAPHLGTTTLPVISAPRSTLSSAASTLVTAVVSPSGSCQNAPPASDHHNPGVRTGRHNTDNSDGENLHPGPVDPRAPNTRTIRADLLCPKSNVAHSSRVANIGEERVLHLASVVSKCHDAKLLRFFCLACCEWLPVEGRLETERRDSGRGGLCKLCGCHKETIRHVFMCKDRRLARAANAMFHRCLEVLTAAGVRIRQGEPAPNPDANSSDGSRWVQVWFDLSGSYSLEWRWSGSGVIPPLDISSDRFPYVLGVLPRNCDVLFNWVRSEGAWGRRGLDDISKLLADLQRTLIQSALWVYHSRCRLVHEWWRSSAARDYRFQLMHDRAVRARKRREGREAKAIQLLPPPVRSSPYPDRARTRVDHGQFISGSDPTDDEVAREFFERCADANVKHLPWW